MSIRLLSPGGNSFKLAKHKTPKHFLQLFCSYPLIFVFLNRVFLLLGSGSLRPLEVVQGLGEVMLEPLSLQLPLSRVHGILLGVAVEVLQLEGAILCQLLGVMLNLVPGNDQILPLTIKSKPFLQLFF